MLASVKTVITPTASWNRNRLVAHWGPEQMIDSSAAQVVSISWFRDYYVNMLCSFIALPRPLSWCAHCFCGVVVTIFASWSCDPAFHPPGWKIFWFFSLHKSVFCSCCPAILSLKVGWHLARQLTLGAMDLGWSDFDFHVCVPQSKLG